MTKSESNCLRTVLLVWNGTTRHFSISGHFWINLEAAIFDSRAFNSSVNVRGAVTEEREKGDQVPFFSKGIRRPPPIYHPPVPCRRLAGGATSFSPSFFRRPFARRLDFFTCPRMSPACCLAIFSRTNLTSSTAVATTLGLAILVKYGIMRAMSSPELFKEARHLPVAERLELIDQLIDSVETDSAQTLSPELESELDRRYRAFLARPDEGEPWEVVREEIQRNLDAARTRRQA